MFGVSPIGRKVVTPYGNVQSIGKAQGVNPFFQEDSFSISDDAMILSAALSEAKAAITGEMNKLDTNKINELKAQIQAGSYNVSGRDVASKLLS